MKQVIIIADKQTVQFFTLLGATGFVTPTQAPTTSTVDPAINYIRSNAQSIAGVLVHAQLADLIRERMNRMKEIVIPIISLPDSSGASQVGFLETLMEKAVGMKLEQGNFLQKNQKE